jgi:cell division protein FtsL
MSAARLMCWILLFVLTAASGVQVALTTQTVRELHARLERAQAAQDAELAEHSRLLLERSALASYQNVERIAQTELAMEFPDQVERLPQ